MFVRMRRAIEEVDLYVSIVRFSIGWKEVRPREHLHGNDGGNRDDEGENCMEEEEWHTFAMSETPLTLPTTQKKAGGKDQVVPEVATHEASNSTRPRVTILRGRGGIEIREPVDTIRLADQETAPNEKGKNKRPAEEDTDTDSDSEDSLIIPVLRSTVQATSDVSRPVARRLIFGIPGNPDMPDGEGDSSSSSDSTEELPMNEGQHWGKFDEALHQMLNDPYTPALFGKDAPPVFNDRRGTGILTL